MDYNHTQPGYLMLAVLLVIALFFAFVLTKTGLNTAVIITMALILFILASFSSLNVCIDKKFLSIRFGYGIFRKKFLLKEIASAKAVKNHWYYGWGIRLWLWPPTWIFNISGFDAVEITMKNSRIYRIGTDEPKKLEKAILQAIKS